MVHNKNPKAERSLIENAWKRPTNHPGVRRDYSPHRDEFQAPYPL